MANDFFQFRQFTVRQDRCAMKVGTDGTLLGAWARCPEGKAQRILDVGTGTGLIALMLAQRFPQAEVLGIDIDADAVGQARENAAASPFANRVGMRLMNLAEATGEFDAIVSNPPYFTAALHSPDARRTLARHTDTLSYRLLMECAHRLLADHGELSVVVPTDCRLQLEAEAVLAGFFKVRQCMVSTTPRKAPKRCLLAFRKHHAALELTALTLGTDACRKLTSDFYL